ncbi:MAG: STAS domain-containing protein [Planctomycetota bacterium]|nr:STAS domain-containing protein [Planctomycetota bacterium]MCX8040236.1 STAS domain-containing protein [Planctomycetota bacterium]MDW8372469.1 STAS domain-containing protein [Planctomycetota bacterium]
MKPGLQITETSVRQVRVLHLAGYLDGHTFVEFERRLRELFDAGCCRVVIDLSALSYIASAGVGVIINGQHQAKQLGGCLQLVKPSPAVREIFSILGLDALFTIHDSVEQGVAAAAS